MGRKLAKLSPLVRKLLKLLQLKKSVAEPNQLKAKTEEVSVEEVPFKTITEQDSSLLKGTETVAQVGQEW